MNVTIGATLTGGSTAALTPAGLSAGGKASYTTPEHTRLNPRVVDFLVSSPVQQQATKKNPNPDPGIARAGLKVAFANREASEGCCGTQLGSVIIDLGVRWSLNQPETLADDAIDYIQGLVFTTAFVDAVKKGTLPVA